MLPTFSSWQGRTCSRPLREYWEENQILLFSQTLHVTDGLAAALEQPAAGVYFAWGPDSARYLPHIDRHTSPLVADHQLDLVAAGLRETILDGAGQNVTDERVSKHGSHICESENWFDTSLEPGGSARVHRGKSSFGDAFRARPILTTVESFGSFAPRSMWLT